jgi:DNA-binding CsgD family transcriptional regulator
MDLRNWDSQKLFYLFMKLGLSKREAEVAKALLGDTTIAEIAKELHISPGTVHSHVTSIYKKTGANSSKTLIQFLYKKAGEEK